MKQGCLDDEIREIQNIIAIAESSSESITSEQDYILKALSLERRNLDNRKRKSLSNTLKNELESKLIKLHILEESMHKLLPF